MQLLAKEGRSGMCDVLLMYRACGAETRDEYLCALANDNGLPMACVRKLADQLGEHEDFGALIDMCENGQWPEWPR
jgi:hypothetical protein